MSSKGGGWETTKNAMTSEKEFKITFNIVNQNYFKNKTLLYVAKQPVKSCDYQI